MDKIGFLVNQPYRVSIALHMRIVHYVWISGAFPNSKTDLFSILSIPNPLF